MERRFTCSVCKQAKQEEPRGGTGYGLTEDGKKICYDCCAIRDRKAMIKTGKAALYLVVLSDRYEVTNWPGTLRFPVDHHVKHRNRRRIDVWFTGPDGRRWHCARASDNIELCRCERVA